MSEYKLIYHACGHREQRRIFGSERIKSKQLAYWQARRCTACEEQKEQRLQEPAPAMAC